MRSNALNACIISSRSPRSSRVARRIRGDSMVVSYDGGAQAVTAKNPASRRGTVALVARVGWLFALAACACSNADPAEEPAKASGWLTVTLSEPTGGQRCFGAAVAPYEFGSEAKPLVDQ